MPVPWKGPAYVEAMPKNAKVLNHTNNVDAAVQATIF